MVDNSTFFPNRLTVPSILFILPETGALCASDFKQWGLLWPIRCSCCYSCPCSSSYWRSFGVLAGSFFSLSMHKQGRDERWSTVCSVQPLVVVDNSAFSPSRLTALLIVPILA